MTDLFALTPGATYILKTDLLINAKLREELETNYINKWEEKSGCQFILIDGALNIYKISENCRDNSVG